MAEFRAAPKVSDGVFLFGSACSMGASQMFPHLNATVAFVLFWGGLAGMVLYPAWRWGLHYAKSGSLNWLGVFQTSNKRMSATEFLVVAKDQFRWDFGGESMDPLDLEIGLLQAAVDGTIPFWGRNAPANTPDKVLDMYPLLSIAPQHFAESRLVLHSTLLTTGPRQRGVRLDNRETKTVDMKTVTARYTDLHVGKKEALRWLKLEAPMYRGRTEAARSN